MKNKYTVWGLIRSDKELLTDRTSFYHDKGIAQAAANQYNEHVCEKMKPIVVKKFYLIRANQFK